MGEIINVNGGKLIATKTSIFSIFNQEKYDPRAIPTAWQDFFGLYRSAGLPSSTTFYGAVIPSLSLDVPMDYYAGILLPEGTQTPEGFVALDMQPGDYFSVTHKGAITEIAGSYVRAYGAEFPSAGLEMRNAPHLEIYHSDKDPMSADYEMSIAIPVN